MAAQRQDDFARSVSEAMGRRVRMVMAAAGLANKEDLAIATEVSASTAGRWCKFSTEKANLTIAVALAGQGDLADDWKWIRDFLNLTRKDFPWSESILYSTQPASDQGFRALAAV